MATKQRATYHVIFLFSREMENPQLRQTFEVKQYTQKIGSLIILGVILDLFSFHFCFFLFGRGSNKNMQPLRPITIPGNCDEPGYVHHPPPPKKKKDESKATATTNVGCRIDENRPAMLKAYGLGANGEFRL